MCIKDLPVSEDLRGLDAYKSLALYTLFYHAVLSKSFDTVVYPYGWYGRACNCCGRKGFYYEFGGDERSCPVMDCDIFDIALETS